MRTSQMKLFSLLLVVVVAMAMAAPRSEDVFQKAFEDCMAKTGAHPDDFNDFPKPLEKDELNCCTVAMFPSPMCTIKCVLDKFGMMSPDGILKVEEAFNIALKYSNIPESMKDGVKELIVTCAQEYSTPVPESGLCKRSAGIVGSIVQKMEEKMRSMAPNGTQ